MKHKSLRYTNLRYTKNRTYNRKTYNRKTYNRRPYNRTKNTRKIQRRRKQRTVKQHRRKHLFQVGGMRGPSSVAMPVVENPLPANGGNVYKQVAANTNSQNALNLKLAGGRKYISKKQTGGMGAIGMCVSTLVNSANGWGYVPPYGCMSVPVVKDPMAQELAVSSTHIGATGLANGEHDRDFAK